MSIIPKRQSRLLGLLFFSGLFVLATTSIRSKLVQPTDTALAQQAWQLLAENSRSLHDSPGEVGWRHWATSHEAYQPQNSSPPPPQPYFFDKAETLPCSRSAQNLDSTDPIAQCEVIYENPIITGYILQHRLFVRQMIIHDAHDGSLKFPPESVVMKTEWLPISTSSENYVTTSKDGMTYGLVAFHMKAKVLNNNSQWLWATFIQRDELAKFKATNKPFLPPNDPFGTKPGNTGVSDSLHRLLQSRNVAILEHYVLLGTQTDHSLDTRGLLGNPLIEGLNPDLTIQKTSCVGCHQYARIDTDGMVIFHPPIDTTDLVGRNTKAPFPLVDGGGYDGLSESQCDPTKPRNACNLLYTGSKNSVIIPK